MAADDGSADDGVLADARVRPDDRLIDHRVLLDVAVAPDNRVRTDARAGLDDGLFVDEAGTFDAR